MKCGEADGVKLDFVIPRDQLLVREAGEATQAHNGCVRWRWYHGFPDLIGDAEPDHVCVIAEFTDFSCDGVQRSDPHAISEAQGQ